ncbi:Dcp1p-Dcp2p decapping enzyme complex alpha subunit [Pseudocyphellaria aurata]|nr:Dcp1p-Dcp2p decapping enzyme complex alpha subunit [Pseudocyphellaria aurata]
MGHSVPTIPGNKAEADLLWTFRREVAHLLGRKSTTFPGAQPVSFAARHKLELQKQDYYVCEKSDGIRCLMYLTGDGSEEVTYLIDRKNDYYHVPLLHFPISSEQERDFHTGTLVDGELVNDKMPNGTIQLKYLVFDCLVLDGSSLMHRSLDKRLAYFRDKVFTPYRELYKKYPEEIQYLPFVVDFKNMELGYGIEMMFREILPNLAHGNDGLIFTCKNSPYQFGTDPHILKWKSSGENSIDFRLTLEWPMRDPDSDDPDEDGNMTQYPDYSAMPTCNLRAYRTDGKDDHFGYMHLEEQEWEDMTLMDLPMDDRIVECYLDEQQRWRFLRLRDDKHEANHITTAVSVMESIQDKVSKEELIALAKFIRDEWKKRQGLESAKAKQEHEARKALMVPEATNSPNDGAATERRLDDDGLSANEHSVKKRKLSQDALKQSTIQEATSSPNGTSSNAGAGTKRKAEDDMDSASEHSTRKRKLSHSEGQKAPSTQEIIGSPAGATRSDSSSTKRKVEEDEDSMDENSPTRRRLSPKSGS